MRQLVRLSNTFAGGHLDESGGGGGPYEALIKADHLRFTIRRPHWELSGSEGRNTCQGMGYVLAGRVARFGKRDI